uniref:Uncharacterized protein n=1 Tax=Castor canadensis TaxID=51338 RepID=A0A8C0W684_CASCN
MLLPSSPSWLEMVLEAASPWLLLLLAGASWILARVLTQIYAFYENFHRFHRFPQPPKRNWFMGHLGMVSDSMKEVTELVGNYPQCFITWLGPIVPVITLCHPDTIRPVLSASGTHRERAVDAMVHQRICSPHPTFCVAPAVARPLLLSSSLSALSIFHQLPFHCLPLQQSPHTHLPF